MHAILKLGNNAALWDELSVTRRTNLRDGDEAPAERDES